MNLLDKQLEEIRANVRLRLGLWAVLGILLLQSFLLISDARAAAREESARISKRISSMGAITEDVDWSARADEASSLLLALEQTLRKSTSQGLARAEFESWLLGEAEVAGISGLRADTGDLASLSDAEGYWAVTAELKGSFSPPALYRLLESIESHEKLTVVTALAADASGSGRVVISVQGYYRIDSG